MRVALRWVVVGAALFLGVGTTLPIWPLPHWPGDPLPDNIFFYAQTGTLWRSLADRFRQAHEFPRVSSLAAHVGRNGELIFISLLVVAFGTITGLLGYWWSLGSRGERFHRALLVVGFVVGVPALYVVWSCMPFGGISPYNYSRIRTGMTDKDVERIIGLPPGIHRTHEPVGGLLSGGNFGFTILEAGLQKELLPRNESGVTRDGALHVTLKQWWGTDHAIKVALDEDGVVVGKYLIEVKWGVTQTRPKQRLRWQSPSD
jgi:hypothetical protein